MTPSLFVRYRCFKPCFLFPDTCVLLKFTSNLKPQARSDFSMLSSSSYVCYYRKKINLLHLHNWSKLLINCSVMKTNYSLGDIKYLSCFWSDSTIRKFQNVDHYKSFNRTCNCNSTVHYPYLTENVIFRSYSKKPGINNKHFAIKKQEYLKVVLRDKQRKIRLTQQNLKRSGRLILDDIKETKSKVKVKMEEIIERENVLTIPNLLCVTRIAMSPYLGYLIIQSDYSLALCLAVFAGVTDLLDGLIARTFKSQSSKLGSFLDPMADKVLIATLFLTLTISGNMPVPLTILIVARDVVLFGAGFYIRYQSLPPPRTLSRYFDMTHATAQLAPTTISKINTMIQLTTVYTTLTAVVFGYSNHPALHGLWYLTAGSTMASALSYLTAKNTYKILKRNKSR